MNQLLNLQAMPCTARLGADCLAENVPLDILERLSSAVSFFPPEILFLRECKRGNTSRVYEVP